MLSSLYRCATRFLRPFFDRMLQKRLARGKEDKARLSERRGQPGLPRPTGKLVWIHGASVGESLSALPLIDRILAADQHCHVLLTTGTVTSARLMGQRLPDRAIHQYIPLDHPDWVQNFMRHWQPEAVIWLESDFWPNMLREIRDLKIPAVLINARMSERSFSRWRWLGKGMIGEILSSFDFCLAQNEFEQQRLQAFGHKKVYVSDNLKYAAQPLPVDKEAAKALTTGIGKRPVWQYISTHPGEEEIAFTLHQHLKADIPELLTVIVPRHPDRGAEIATLAMNKGLNLARRSQDMPVTADSDIYLADTMGELGVFSATIPLVVMGGSFVPHGGHNPVEPAQFSCMVIYGPHMFNFKTICADFEAVNAALPVENEQALQDTLKTMLQNPAQMEPYRAAALKLTRNKSGAIDTLWSYLYPWLDLKQPAASKTDRKAGVRV